MLEEQILVAKGEKLKCIQEVWVECYCDYRYEVSNLGLIRKKPTDTVKQKVLIPHIFWIHPILKRTEDSFYWGIRLSRYGIKSDNMLHHLVYRSFNGYEKGVIDHINGIKQDNRLVNLRDISRVENSRKQNKDESLGLF